MAISLGVYPIFRHTHIPIRSPSVFAPQICGAVLLSGELLGVPSCGLAGLGGLRGPEALNFREDGRSGIQTINPNQQENHRKTIGK